MELQQTKSTLVKRKQEIERLRALQFQSSPKDHGESDDLLAQTIQILAISIENVNRQSQAIRPHLIFEPFLHGLSDLQRQVVIARYCGEKYKPLASCLKKTPNNLRVTFSTAVNKINENLAHYQEAMALGLTHEESLIYMKLTPTERKVYPLWLEGMNPRQIAARIEEEPKKIRDTVRRLQRKLASDEHPRKE